MKILVLAFAAVLVASPLRASVPVSFDSALAAYNANRHEAARASFLRMARDGQPDAQFNLAVMQARGEGGPVQLTEAVLWMTLASEAGHGQAVDALDVITTHVPDDERAEIEDRLPSWRKDFSRQALLDKHRPLFCSDCLQSEIDARHADRDELTHLIRGGSLRVDRKRPRYPREAAIHRMVGYVELGGWLNEDGVLEAIHVLSSEPENVFENSALEALDRWEFEWLTPSESREPFPVRQTIIFKLDEFAGNYRLERRLRHDLAVGLEEVERNAMPAYRAAYTLDFIGHEVDPDHPARLIELAEMAARQGAVIAQREVARRLRVGDQVQLDLDAELFWLKQAAYAGDPVAQYQLSLRSERLGEGTARDFRAEAVAAEYVPALLAEIRREVQKTEGIQTQRLQALIEDLPRRWQRRRNDDPMLQRAFAQLER